MSASRKLGSSEGTKFRLTIDTINPYVKEMEYAVRGSLPQEAARIEAEIKKVRIGIRRVCMKVMLLDVFPNS